MQTLSALCNAPVVGLQAPTCDGLNSSQHDEILEVNQRMNIWKALLRVQLVLGLVIFLHGCVLPYPMPPKTIQTMIPEESLDFLEIGQTTKDEIRKTLGKPWETWETDEADNYWVYKLRIVLSGRWGLAQCVAPPSGHGDCDTSQSDGKAVLYVLRIDFDDADVVRGWEEFKL